MAKKSGIKGAKAKNIEIEMYGEKYQASPLTLEDFSKIWEKLQSRKLRLVKDNFDDPEIKRDLIREILNQPMSDEFFDEISSVEGIKFLIHTSISKNHDDITEEDIGELPISDMEEISDVILAISGIEEEDVDLPSKKGGE